MFTRADRAGESVTFLCPGVVRGFLFAVVGT
jgi:hypothetical protein